MKKLLLAAILLPLLLLGSQNNSESNMRPNYSGIKRPHDQVVETSNAKKPKNGDYENIKQDLLLLEYENIKEKENIARQLLIRITDINGILNGNFYFTDIDEIKKLYMNEIKKNDLIEKINEKYKNVLNNIAKPGIDSISLDLSLPETIFKEYTIIPSNDSYLHSTDGKYTLELSSSINKLWNTSDPNFPELISNLQKDIVEYSVNGIPNGSFPTGKLYSPIYAVLPAYKIHASYNYDNSTLYKFDTGYSCKLNYPVTFYFSSDKKFALTSHDGFLLWSINPNDPKLISNFYEWSIHPQSKLQNAKLIAAFARKVVDNYDEYCNCEDCSPGDEFLFFGQDKKYFLMGKDRKSAKILFNDYGIWYKATIISKLKGHTKKITTTSVSSDAQYALTGSKDKTAILWDISNPRDPKLVSTLKGHTDAVMTVGFHPNNHYAFTGSSDKTIKVWDITDPKNPQEISTSNLDEPARDACVEFSPDAKYLLFASRFWDISNPKKIKHISNHIFSIPDHGKASFLSFGSNYNYALTWLRHTKILYNFNASIFDKLNLEQQLLIVKTIKDFPKESSFFTKNSKDFNQNEKNAFDNIFKTLPIKLQQRLINYFGLAELLIYLCKDVAKTIIDEYLSDNLIEDDDNKNQMEIQ